MHPINRRASFDSKDLHTGDFFPNLHAVSTAGEIESLHAYFGGSWGIFFTHVRAFSPIGTTEL